MYIAVMVKSQANIERRTQEARRQAMKRRLIDAAVSSLIDQGYARTTAVEVCKRAGVTRGALFHHYDSLPDLLADALAAQFETLFDALGDKGDKLGIECWLRAFWHSVSSPTFKAVVEIWLAARNDPDATGALQHVMDRIADFINPLNHPALAFRLEQNEQAHVFYLTAMETMFGLTLGRATSPDHAPLPHEGRVLTYLFAEADRFDQAFRSGLK